MKILAVLSIVRRRLFREQYTGAWTLVGGVLVLLCLLGWSPIAPSPWRLIWGVMAGAFGSWPGFLETLTRTIPILLCALAVAVPARAGLFNIGGEGQFHCGAIAATFVLLTAGHLPSPLLFSLQLLAAVIGGAICAAIPALLRGRFGVSEILTGLMLNFVAINLMLYLVHGPWRDPKALGWPYAVAFPEEAVFSRWRHTNVHSGLLVGLAAAVILFVVFRTRVIGATSRYLAGNIEAARRVGVPILSSFVFLFLAGGALAALAGWGEASVVQGRLRPALSAGYGYIGFLVSWLSGHRFLAIIPIAIFAGGLYSGVDTLQLDLSLPSATADVLIGAVFLSFLAASHAWIMAKESRREKGATT